MIDRPKGGPEWEREATMYEGSMEDRLAIRELVDSYSDAVNRIDAAAWSACWADDAIWRFHGRAIEGREAIVTAWRGAMASYRRAWFMASPGMIAVTGDEARMRVHTFEYLVDATGAARLQSGLYEDRLVRRDGAWKFIERQFSPQEMPL